MKKMSEEKRTVLRIAVSASLFAAGIILERIYKDASAYLWLAVYLPAYFVIGYDVLWRALRNIQRGKVFDENFLMALATIGAFLIGEYPEAAAVMIFYQTGELFQHIAVEKSRKSISALLNIRPDYANLKGEDGSVSRVNPEEVRVGSFIVVKPGERVPLDGIVTDGVSTLDTSALTGESLPREIAAGGEILSGTVNLSGVLTVRVTKEFSESTVSKILDLVENAASNKSSSENFITKFARYYTPAVVLLAAALAVLPPLIIGLTGGGYPFSEWIYRALTFLVISCPCALVISIPLSFFGGIGGASKKGILIKGGNYLEALASAEIAVFDKTGTLTKGVFRVQKILPEEGRSEEEILELAALAESFSSHPIANSIKEAYGKEIAVASVQNVEEIAGHGVKCEIGGAVILAGNKKLMEKYGVESFKEADETGTVVYVAKNGRYAGAVVIADEVKKDAKDAIIALKKAGVKKTVMLTGDNKRIGEYWAKELNMDEACCELLPQGKVAAVQELMKEKSKKGKLLFTGDGLNDAPVLARSDIGIAMGGLGSDAAIEAADIVIMTDEPSKIADAIKISKRTLRIVKQNIIFSLAVKFSVLILGAFGIATMWEAVFADVGVSVIAILNAVRLIRPNENRRRYAQTKRKSAA